MLSRSVPSLSLTVLLLSALSSSLGQDAAQEAVVESSADLVGRWRDDVIVTSVNQVLTPFGKQIELPGMRPQAMALSPDGKTLVVAGKTSELVIIDPEKGEVRQRVLLPNDSQVEPPPQAPSPNILQPDRSGQVSYTGLFFTPDGKRIYLSNVNGSIKVFSVTEHGQVKPSHSFPLPPANAPRRKQEIPSGLALSDDSAKLYVCGNLSNKLHELDTATGKLLRSIDVGVAPYDVVLVGDKAFVSNWGGRRPGPEDPKGPAGRGTDVRVDPVRNIASEGSVSVIDLETSKATVEILTGLHACALAVSPDKKYVVCANAGSDHLSVLDVASEKILDTIWVKASPSDLFGASPNALAFSADGKTLYAANGTQNAVAVIHFEPEDKGESKLQGLIPVGWFPGALVGDHSRHSLYVANIKGLSSTPKKQRGTEGFNSHQYQGSVSLIPLPKPEQLAPLSERAARNMRRGSIAQAALPPRRDQPPRAIPQRIGEPSPIKYVVYVLKENRTYDQVLGDLKEGRGHAGLCIFGADVTPNQHKLVREFVLLDNTYCAGILSADGHQWSTTAFSTDYMEKSFAGFPRSYPDGMGEDEADALAYSPAGFLWDNALAHKKTIRNYGEFMKPRVHWREPGKAGIPPFLACFRTWKGEAQEAIFESEPAIETIRPFSPKAYVGWEMNVPDQYRADFILKELKQLEEKGDFPNLVIICLPNDHTSGTSPGSPTPASCVADNDLAFGRIVEGLSNSKFWKEMAIFAIEDDPQDGWDHVSGYRTTAYCVSPFAKRGQAVSTQYNTTSIVRTIEQILGLPPMNQFDASATPLFDCFSDTPDFTPFESVANTIPLDQMNPDPKSILDPQLRKDALVSAALNFHEIDKAPEDTLNRILWRSRKGSREPYPEWAIRLVEDDEATERPKAAKAKSAPANQAVQEAAELHVGELRVGKVLFLGNSITLHGPAPKIGWSGNWGMAASTQEKDYVHLLLDRIAKSAGGKPAVMVKNIADFERGLHDFDLKKGLKQELAFDADLIIVAVGENASELKTEEAKTKFRDAFVKLLAELKNHGRPTLVVRSCFWANPAKDEIMKQACQDAGGVFVDNSKLSSDESNFARSERKFEHAGVSGHPGDKGMQAIADSIWSAIQNRAAMKTLPPK